MRVNIESESMGTEMGGALKRCLNPSAKSVMLNTMGSRIHAALRGKSSARCGKAGYYYWLIFDVKYQMLGVASKASWKVGYYGDKNGVNGE
jgi:hypothetical protein